MYSRSRLNTHHKRTADDRMLAAQMEFLGHQVDVDFAAGHLDVAQVAIVAVFFVQVTYNEGWLGLVKTTDQVPCWRCEGL